MLIDTSEERKVCLAVVASCVHLPQRLCQASVLEWGLCQYLGTHFHCFEVIKLFFPSIAFAAAFSQRYTSSLLQQHAVDESIA